MTKESDLELGTGEWAGFVFDGPVAWSPAIAGWYGICKECKAQMKGQRDIVKPSRFPHRVDCPQRPKT